MNGQAEVPGPSVAIPETKIESLISRSQAELNRLSDIASRIQNLHDSLLGETPRPADGEAATSESSIETLFLLLDRKQSMIDIIASTLESLEQELRR